jgi:hypothetical protein
MNNTIPGIFIPPYGIGINPGKDRRIIFPEF